MPETPNFDKEANAAAEYDGLPPLFSRKSKHVVFVNINTVYTKNGPEIDILDHGGVRSEWSTAIVKDGTVTCLGNGSSCREISGDTEVIDLQGGSLGPGLTTFGSPIGLVEILLEATTNDGAIYDPLLKNVPSIIEGEQSIIRAVDGLQFGGRDTL